MSSSQVRAAYFSDVLCVWAYVGQRRVTELKKQFGDRVSLIYRFIHVFGHVPDKIARNWADRGGIDAYRDHVLGVAAQFPHVDISPQVWTRNTPASAGPAHVFLKAVALSCDASREALSPQERWQGRDTVEEAAWQVRLAFFRDARDVSKRGELLDIARSLDLDVDRINRHLDDGTALAEIWLDQARKEHHGVVGSPTWVLNRGRQKLFGNVGYRIVEANVEELLRGNAKNLSWC